MSRLAPFTAAALLLLACDPDPGDERPLSSLSLAEVDQACTAVWQTAGDEDIRGMARLYCATVDVGEEACGLDSLEVCTATVFQRWRPMHCELQPEVFAAVQACEQPVQRLLDCFAQHLAGFGAFQDATCETVDDIDLAEPAACQELERACPGLDVRTLEDQLTD